MSRRRTADSAIVKKAKKERKYGLKRQLKTIENRRNRQAKHLKMVEKKQLRRGLF